MVAAESIIAWLGNVPDVPEHPEEPSKAACAPQRPRKRKRESRERHLVSPPISVDHHNTVNQATFQMAQETPKKRRLSKLDDVLDLTPRAGIAHKPASTLSDTGSSLSRASSSAPKRQLMSLQLSDSGVEIKALNVDRPPSQKAKDLLSSIEDISCAMDILPHDMEPIISEQIKARKLDYHKWRHSFQRSEGALKLPGRIPSFEEVERIQRKATECQEDRHEEFGWNYQVHLRLLESVFEDMSGPCDDFRIATYTSARPHRNFKVPFSPAKMIDMCVFASPRSPDENWAARMTHFRRYSPTQTVNHTDFEAISTRPLLLSMETKKPGVHWDTAQLQIGLWHAAQWSFLAWAVDQKLARQGSDMHRAAEFDEPTEASRTERQEQPRDVGEVDKQDETERQTQRRGARKAAALSALGFLPGIIVQGHRWHLVLSTFDAKSGKTTLWTDLQFGTTLGYREIYATIAGVRRLTAWTRDVYLPWFEANALD